MHDAAPLASNYYLFGDGRTSPHTTNVLELIEAAVRFGVAALTAVEAEEYVTKQRADKERATEKSLRELRAAAKRVAIELRSAHEDPAVAAWSITVERDMSLRLAEQERHLNAQLASTIEALDEAVDERRRDWRVPLIELLSRRDLPGSNRSLEGNLTRGSYLVERVFRTVWGLDGTLTVDVRGTAFQSVARAVAFARPLTTRVAGHPLGQAQITSFRRGSDKTTIALQSPDATVTNIVLGGRGRIFLLSEEGHPMVADGELFDELSRLAGSLVAAFDELETRPLVRTRFTLDERPLEGVLKEAVERITAQLAADVAEIARRSPSPDELVLKRPLGGHRREELFLDRRQLGARARLLSRPLRSLLTPLGVLEAMETLPRIPFTSHPEATPVGPFSRPDQDEEREHTAHGPGTPSLAPESEHTLTSAGVLRKPEDEGDA